ELLRGPVRGRRLLRADSGGEYQNEGCRDDARPIGSKTHGGLLVPRETMQRKRAGVESRSYGWCANLSIESQAAAPSRRSAVSSRRTCRSISVTDIVKHASSGSARLSAVVARRAARPARPRRRRAARLRDRAQVEETTGGQVRMGPGTL